MIKFEIIILEEAEIDIEDAFSWYEFHQIGLGIAFVKELNKTIKHISMHPNSCEIIMKNIHRALIKKFPFGVYYTLNAEEKIIQILAILHFKRNLNVIKKR